MPECIDCGTHVRTGSRCQQCQVERDWEHHEFFQLLGQSIMHSSGDRPVKALSSLEDAQAVLEDQGESMALTYVREARRHEPSSYRWREACENAKDELEADA
jgi:hypothetical protein